MISVFNKKLIRKNTVKIITIINIFFPFTSFFFFLNNAAGFLLDQGHKSDTVCIQILCPSPFHLTKTVCKPSPKIQLRNLFCKKKKKKKKVYDKTRYNTILVNVTTHIFDRLMIQRPDIFTDLKKDFTF